MPFPETLITDAAPQYELLALYHALCWIHDGRHYEKLDPLTENFRTRYWEYYHELAAWRQSPEAEVEAGRDSSEAERLEKKFDQLFGSRTGYRELDERIAKTLAKKEKLLVVLEKPKVPLHNNGSELAARRAARRRNISLHSRSQRGVDAMDALTSVVETCRKLGVRVAGYIYDRLCGQSRPKNPSAVKRVSRESRAQDSIQRHLPRSCSSRSSDRPWRPTSPFVLPKKKMGEGKADRARREGNAPGPRPSRGIVVVGNASRRLNPAGS